MHYTLLSKLPRGLAELSSRLAFLVVAVTIFRIGVQTPLPGVDLQQISEMFLRNKSNLIVGYFDIFTGGALLNMSLLALGIYPYISASIMIQFLSHALPALEKLRKEGEKGRQALNQYTRYLTFCLALLQSVGVAKLLVSMNMITASPYLFYYLAVLSLTTGTMLMMWLGDQITRYGVGNGVSILMFSGIVTKLPESFVALLSQAKQGQISMISLVTAFTLISSTILFIVCMERAQRKIPLIYPRRHSNPRHKNQMPDSNSVLPLKLNMSGVLPPIVSQMLIVIPVGAIDYLSKRYPDNIFFSTLGNVVFALNPGSPFYMAIFSCLVIFFAYYLTAVFFDTKEISDNLKARGAMISGIRPGLKTSIYIDTLLTKTTLIGAIYLAFVASLPDLLIRYLKMPALFGGTSLLIAVVVVMDFVTQVQTLTLPGGPSQGAGKAVSKTRFLD